MATCPQGCVMALLALAATILIAPSAWAVDEMRWQATSSGCLVWNPIPEPSETVTWSGGCVDGKASGFGTEVFRYRELGVWKEERYVGEMEGGRLNGRGTLSYDNGDRYEGEFRDGKPAGRGMFTFLDGRRYEGDVADGHFHGRGIYTFPDGAQYAGGFAHGLANGAGTLTRPGETVTGSWSNGCLREGGRIAAVGVSKEMCGASVQADYLIVPGQRIGALMLDGRIADIAYLLGPGKERAASSWPGPGAVLTTWDAVGVWVISDKSTGNILWISVEPNKFAQWDRYATKDGLRMGVTESQIVSVLGQPERSLDEGGMRSLYYDGRGIRFILGKEGAYAGRLGGIRIVWPSVAHGDTLIVPGERISAISLGETVERALPRLGGGYMRSENLRGDQVYYWPHLGLSLVAHAGRVVSVRSGTIFPTDAANLGYETADGIGRGGSSTDITRVFGTPGQVRPESRFARAAHWWIYPSHGIAFALDDQQRIRIVDVFTPEGLQRP